MGERLPFTIPLGPQGFSNFLKRKITENHGKSRKITEMEIWLFSGKSRKITENHGNLGSKKGQFPSNSIKMKGFG
jgi:hypothetical protein